MTVQVDHLVVCVPDLEKAGELWQRVVGLGSVPGGRHHGHGTENRLVPLGPRYVELISLADPVEASSSPFGRWVGERAAPDLHFDGFVMRTGAIDHLGDPELVASTMKMSRVRPDGFELRWRLAGMGGMTGPARLPMVIQWEAPEMQWPGRAVADHARRPTGEIAVTISGDPEALPRWLLTAEDVTVISGSPGLGTAVIGIDDSHVELSGR